MTYISKQLHVASSALERYGNRPKTRTEHLKEIQQHLGFHTASQIDLENLSQWLLERTLEHDKPSLLLQLLCEKLYQEKIVRPGITRLEKMVGTARSQAQEETFKRVSPLLTTERKKFLDVLLESDKTTNRTNLSWLNKGATSNTASAMLSSLEKLTFLRKQQVSQWELLFENVPQLPLKLKEVRKFTSGNVLVTYE